MTTNTPTRSRVRLEAQALTSSVFFLALGLLVVWVAKEKLAVEGDAVLVSLLLVPLLVYLAVSGRLREVKGPGGLEARFAEAAAESASGSIAAGTQSVDVTGESQVVRKEGIEALRRKGRELDRTRPIIMTMTVGGGTSYDWEAIRRYLGYLSQFPNFAFIVFVEPDGRFVAYMPAAAFRELMALPELGDEFVGVMNDGRVTDLLRYPGVVQETLSTRSTNAEALMEMTRRNLDALVVIDDTRRLKAVVGRDQVVGHILLGLTSASGRRL